MAKKIKLTRPELKRQRDALARYMRYLPTLKLKQQQLQATVLQVERELRSAEQAVSEAAGQIEPYRQILADRAGINVDELAAPSEIRRGRTNIAGVALPVFEGVSFPPLTYSLFATPPWVDRAIADFRRLNELRAKADIVAEQVRRLRHELRRITQRVNLFEKLMIPGAREAIRVIRIKLGDEQTAAVGRAKIAKSKLAEIHNNAVQAAKNEEAA